MWKLYRPDSIRVWKDAEVVRRLRRYRFIIDQERHAKYLLSKDIETSIPLDSSMENLWTEHDALSAKHSEYVRRVDAGGDRAAAGSSEMSFLDLKYYLIS